MNIIGEFLSTIKQSDKNLIDKKILQYSKEHFLQSKTLKEIYHNLNQILDIINHILESKDEK